MTNIKALDKLREKIQLDVNNPWSDLKGDLLAMCDKVEREISERFIALPVDEEGDVLRIGDELKCQGESILLNSLSWDGRRWYVTETIVSSGWYPVHLCRHVKPRTIEDVLCLALADVSCMGDGIVRTFKPDEPYVAELAAEIREVLGVEK